MYQIWLEDRICKSQGKYMKNYKKYLDYTRLTLTYKVHYVYVGRGKEVWKIKI